jgi:hypothetical protein
LLLATSKDVGGRPSPAMTRKLQRSHLEDLFPDGHLALMQGRICRIIARR